MSVSGNVITEKCHRAEEALVGRAHREVALGDGQHERDAEYLDGVAGVGERAQGEQDDVETADADQRQRFFEQIVTARRDDTSVAACARSHRLLFPCGIVVATRLTAGRHVFKLMHKITTNSTTRSATKVLSVCLR